MSKKLLLLSLSLVSTTGIAKKLYKYQDEQQVWHFSDQPPASQHEVEVRQLKPAAKNPVSLERAGDKNSPDFYIFNQYPGPVEVKIDWANHDNVISTPPLPQRFTVEPGKSATLFNVSSTNHTQSSRFTLQYQYVPGRPLVDYVNPTLYFPPIAAGTRFQITQGFNGEFSHNDAQNRYAVDIMMPIDTPVYAARGGVVLDVENDYYTGGANQAYASKANSIRILHDDGSMAVYAHLALEKAQVQPGLQVAAGQLIAYSGNTGYTSGPHLHFAIQINKGMELVSVPFQFVAAENQALEPTPDIWLTGLEAKTKPGL